MCQVFKIFRKVRNMEEQSDACELVEVDVESALSSHPRPHTCAPVTSHDVPMVVCKDVTLDTSCSIL